MRVRYRQTAGDRMEERETEGRARGPEMEADFSGGIVLGQPEEMGQREAPQGAISIKMTYSTDKARIVPAVAQGLQKPIPGINLKVTAVAFRAKHLLVVWGERTVKEAEAVSGTDTVLQVAIRLK